MFPHEQLEVYKKAYHTNQKIYRLFKENNRIAGYIKNQLGRACLSVMLNIAEGSAKFSARGRRNFFIVARGSVFECSSLICFLHEEGEIEESLKKELYESLNEISIMLYRMIKNLEGQ